VWSKLRILPPKDLRYGGSAKLHPEVYRWLSSYGGYSVITYWFKFPYDLIPGDGVEYEPLSIIECGEGLREVQVRAHWRLIGFSRDVLDLSSGYLVVSFTDSGHTPLPKLNEGIKLRELMSRTYVLSPEVLNDSVTLLSVTAVITYSLMTSDWGDAYEPVIHEGGGPTKDLRVGRDPLSKPWVVPEGLSRVGTPVVNAWLSDVSGLLNTPLGEVVSESIKYLGVGDALEAINSCVDPNSRIEGVGDGLLKSVINAFLKGYGVSRGCVDYVLRKYLPLTIVTSVLPNITNLISKELLPKVLKASLIVITAYLSDVGDVLSAYLRRLGSGLPT